MSQAAEIQERLVRIGFDWPDIDGVRAKIAEELEEVQQATYPKERSSKIVGLLFAVVNYARWLSVDPEAVLREANLRFRRRFGHLEAVAKTEGRDLGGMTLKQMDDLWEKSKAGDE